MIMNKINQTFASLFRTTGAEQKIEEKITIRKDSLNTWDSERFYPMVRYKYNHGLLFNRKEALINVAIKLIPIALITGWALSKYLF